MGGTYRYDPAIIDATSNEVDGLVKAVTGLNTSTKSTVVSITASSLQSEDGPATAKKASDIADQLEMVMAKINVLSGNMKIVAENTRKTVATNTANNQ